VSTEAIRVHSVVIAPSSVDSIADCVNTSTSLVIGWMVALLCHPTELPFKKLQKASDETMLHRIAFEIRSQIPFNEATKLCSSWNERLC
jgi:hypothetical protein